MTASKNKRNGALSARTSIIKTQHHKKEEAALAHKKTKKTLEEKLRKAKSLRRALRIAQTICTSSEGVLSSETTDTILAVALDHGFVARAKEDKPLINDFTACETAVNLIIREYVTRGLAKDLKETRVLAAMIGSVWAQDNGPLTAKIVFEAGLKFAGDICDEKTPIKTIAGLAATIMDFGDGSHSKPHEDMIIKAALVKGVGCEDMLAIAKNFRTKTGERRLAWYWLQANDASLEEAASITRSLNPINSKYCGTELTKAIICEARPHLNPAEANTVAELMDMAEISKLMIEFYIGKRMGEEVKRAIALEKAIVDAMIAKMKDGTAREIISDLTQAIGFMNLLVTKSGRHEFYSFYMYLAGTKNYEETAALAEAFLGIKEEKKKTGIIVGGPGSPRTFAAMLGLDLPSILGAGGMPMTLPGIKAIRMVDDGDCATCSARKICPQGKEQAGIAACGNA